MRFSSAFAASALVASAAAAAAPPAAPLASYSGEHTQCLGGQVHTLSYSAKGLDSTSFVDLDGDLGSQLSSMACDIDHTRLTLNFHNAAEATEWVVKFHDFSDHFIVGGTRWNCTSVTGRPGYILRRVVGASQGPHLSKTLTITTAMAQYDEVFESADIAYGSSGACDASEPRWQAAAAADAADAAADAPMSVSSHTTLGGKTIAAAAAGNDGIDKQLCLGFNTDCHGAASQAYPLFSGKHLSVSCTDCWASLKTDVFVNVSIGDWKLKSLRGGFQNATLNASAVLGATASANWNVALDKSLPLAATTYLLNFKVGAVPFMLYFDVPMEITGSLEFDSGASLTVGTKASLALGDAFVEWDPVNHWTHTDPRPDFAGAVLPVLSAGPTTADVNMNGDIKIVPTFHMHFDQVFSYSLSAAPTAHASVAASQASKQACLSATYDMDLVSTAAAHINIDLIDFHKDWNWGPTTIFSKSGNVVPQTCVPL
jgi:hypothetical protein